MNTSLKENLEFSCLWVESHLIINYFGLGYLSSLFGEEFSVSAEDKLSSVEELISEQLCFH